MRPEARQWWDGISAVVYGESRNEAVTSGVITGAFAADSSQIHQIN